MANFWMKLQSINGKCLVLGSSHWAGFSRCQWDEILGVVIYLVAMAHPDGDFGGDIFEHAIRRFGVTDGFAEFSRWGALDIGAQRFAGKLHTVANSKHGNSELKDFRVTLWRPIFINAGRATAQNYPFGVKFFDALCRNIVANNLTKYVQLSHSASDKLPILRSKIKD